MKVLIHYYQALGYAIYQFTFAGVTSQDTASATPDVLKEAIMSWLDAGWDVTIETIA